MTEESKKEIKSIKDCCCNSCSFFRWNEQEQRFECRRNAPRWNSGSGTGCTDTLWPEVTANLWCGEWEKSSEWLYA